MKLIQVSDLHLVPPGVRLLGLDPRARLEACIADINANHGDAELCLFTGDLADRGAPAAYRELRDVLAALAVPYRLLIGNHDDREVFRNAFPEAPLDENGFVQSVVRASAGDLVLLDTHEPGTGAGSFCEQRQAWLGTRLAEAGGRPVYLFMHHPPFDIGIPSLDRIRLEQPEGFAAALDGTANIVHLFFGHVHRPVSGSWRGIPFSALRSTVHQVPLDFETEAPVPYNHESPAYAVILIGDGCTVVHHHCYLDNSHVPPGTERYAPAT
ncbi:MAG: phosphodiesterase [Rhodospirillales bacterium]|nr:phosphodiesterase [Rhodospirillales bacterium]MDH3914143.1 phosphodiesterase [Rhodospirillales bacterium]MDH3920110.1 phosphodiesterase [Rhodospirillales bacterium]